MPWTSSMMFNDSSDNKYPCLVPHLIVTVMFFLLFLDLSTLVRRCPNLVHLDLRYFFVYFRSKVEKSWFLIIWGKDHNGELKQLSSRLFLSSLSRINVWFSISFLLPSYSDSVMLKTDCFQEFFQLNYLQHLSLSRCYDIIPETLL